MKKYLLTLLTILFIPILAYATRIEVSNDSDTLDSVTDRGSTTTNSITTGDISVSETGPNINLTVTGGDEFGWHAESQITYLKNDTDGKFYLLADTNHYLNLVPYMTDGRVGINQGLGSPSYNLDVTGTGHFTSTLKIGAYTLPATDGTNGQQLTTDGAGNITFGAAGGHDAVTVTDTTTINLTLTGQDITADGLYTAGDDLTLTGADFDVDATVTRDTEWDTLAEINTASTDADILQFQTLSVAAQSDVVAEAIADTLTLVGAGITAITTNATTDTITFTSTEIDGSTSNEINTIQGDDDVATSGLAISIDGAGIVTTDVVGDVLTVTGTEVDGSITNELPIAGNLIDISGAPASTVDVDLTEAESVTWGAGAAATIVHTYNVSGTDTTMTMGSGATTFSGTVAGSNLSGTNTGDQTITLTGDVTGTGTGSFAATIAADSVALTTDTTGNYVATVADGTGIDGTAAGEGATYTPSLDLTEINSATFGSGTFTTLTFDAGATDPVLTMASNVFAITTGNVGIGTTGPATQLDITGDLTVRGGDITLGTSAIFSGGDTTSLNLIDAIDATTETTLEGAIDSLANLTVVGTIATGVWNGTDIAFADGGTGISSWTQYLIPYAATTTSIGQIAIGTSGQVLTSNGAGAAPTFQAAAGGGDTLDVFTVGANGDYTTIQAALNAASAGDTILVSEGTYTESLTFGDDNVALIATGSVGNTIITQVAAQLVNFGIYSGCAIRNFTLSVTAATDASHTIIDSSNDAVTIDLTEANIVEDCILKWASPNALSAFEVVDIADGDFIFNNNVVAINNTYAGTTTSYGFCFRFRGAPHTYKVNANKISVNFDCTSSTANTAYCLWLAGTLHYFTNNHFVITGDYATTAELVNIYPSAGTTYLLGNILSSVQNSTGVAKAIYGGTTVYSIGNQINCTTSDADGKWQDSSTTFYSIGDVVTGDAGYIAATNDYISSFIKGQFINSLTSGLAATNATEAGAMFWDGIVIGTDTDNFIIDDATHGSGVGALYLGNATIDATFTGFHYYKLGDTDLQMGELVKLVDGKLYHSTKKQDPTAIGLYCGLTNWKDSLGNTLIDGKEVDVTYDEVDKITGNMVTKTKKIKDYRYETNAVTKQDAVLADYPRSVAVVGDSMHENQTNPLMGAWVCDLGGQVKNGTYLTSSSKAGFLQAQSDDVMHSYTIAKAREDIVFDEKGENRNSYIYLLQ